MVSMFENNIIFMEELDKFNQDHEQYKMRYRLMVDDLPISKYVYVSKTLSEIQVKQKKSKVKVRRKDIDSDGKLF